MTKPTFPPSAGHAIFMWDQNRYEFYASAPPGSSTYTAWWVTPYRGVTLTPYDKESDPNPLSLLLGTERDGFLHVWYTFDLPSGTFMGKDISRWVGNRVNAPAPTEPILYYSRAVLVPQAPDVEPVVNVKDPKIAVREPAGRSKSRSQGRGRMKVSRCSVHRDRCRVIKKKACNMAHTKLAILASAAAALTLTVQGADAASLTPVTGALAGPIARLVLPTQTLRPGL